MTRASLPLVLVALVSLVGCDCGRKPEVTQSYAELGVVWRDKSGAERTDRDATFDFGAALVGERVPKKLVIKNLGTGPLTLLSLEQVEGDEVAIGVPSATASFEVRFTAGQTIGALEEVELDMFFTPVEPSKSHLAHLVLRGGGTDPEASTATITLLGSSAAAGCQLPKEIDFGRVLLNETAQAAYDIHNLTAVPTSGTASEIYSANADFLAFGFANGSPGEGPFSLPGGGTTTFTFEFRPTEARAYTASIRLRAASACPEVEVTLKGEGTDTLLSWTPSTLHFGPVSPGTPVQRTLTFFNVGKTPVTLSNLATTLASDFGVQAGASGDPTTLVVPGGGVPTELVVVCNASQLGPREAQLTFTTNLSGQPSGAVPLKAYGGGPKITVIPRPTLAFGKVGYFANANPAPQVVRKLTVMNTGTKPNPPDVSVNLHLGSVDATTGLPGQLPYVTVTPLNGNTAAGEFTVGVPQAYDPSVGLEATPGKNLVDLVVTLTPASVGAKEAELTVFSNDPTEPAVKIRLTADAQVLPPCNYALSPAQLNFGLVTPPNFKELPLTITNLSQAAGDVCYLTGLEIAAGSDPAYSIVGGPVAAKDLMPGEAWQVRVRVAPQGAQPSTTVNLLGNLTFNISSPTKPQGVVPLSTAVGPVCLTIAPDTLDFGTVKKDCNSPARTFTLYNTCSQNVTIGSFTVQAGAGQPAGGPNCPGTSPCPEFHLVSTPPIPSGGLTMQPGSAPLTFTAKYRPIDVGSDSGAIAINAIQGGQNVSYLVTLQGTGDLLGLHTDVFVQDAAPKADILFTIDNSCSMGDEQQSLASNFASFIAYANSTNADYHLGVTTTDDSEPLPGPFPLPSGDRGRLRGDASNPKVLTRSTPNVAQLFQQKVNVGTMGSASERGFSPSLKAVTPPLVSNENAGFLRYDAYLAVVVVTDEAEQSPEAVTWYYNQFLNVKGFNRANLFTFNVIGPFDSTNCPGDDGRYATMVSLTGGLQDNVCTPSWSNTLQQLGKTAFGYRTQFFLNNTPDTTGGKSIEVKIDGVAVPSTDWSYDPVANAIVFDAAKTPGPGQTLSVTYYVACL